VLDNFLVHEFRPLFLTAQGIGPFQETPYVIDFTDSEDQPCNFFLLLSENGRGKTLLMEVMVSLMGQFEQKYPKALGHEEIDNGLGSAQWDFFVRLYREGGDESFVLSLAAGKGHPWQLNDWDQTRLEKYGVKSRSIFALQRHASGRFSDFGIKEDERIADLLAAFQAQSNQSPQAFEGDPLTLPTLIHFSSYRDIPKVTDQDRGIMQPKAWGYRVAHTFDRESQGWQDSLDNLLVWLSWLNDERYQQAIDTINQRVFSGTNKFLKGVRKQPPEAVVMNEGHTHRLDRLSSGEKSLVQLYLRTGIHMTRNTLLLIDEMDVHLHVKWQHRILKLLKQMAKDHAGLTIITSTHAGELIPAFAHDIPEKGLLKGGEIIEHGLNLTEEMECD
jgi:hypothetical protein